jgi:hypothetical protein
MKRFMPLVLVSLLIVAAGSASAGNLLVNGSFQDGNFTGWTLGTTADGTAGQGFPIIACWPPDPCLNSAKYEVGQVNFNPGVFEGATISQMFTSGGGMTTLSVMWAAMGDGVHTNGEGGLFELILDGTILASHDVGQIGPTDLVNGTLTDTLNLSAGTHTFEVDILRPFLANPGNTPYQYITGADVEGPGGTTPEPGTLVMLGSGVLGVAGLLRRKLNF